MGCELEDKNLWNCFLDCNKHASDGFQPFGCQQNMTKMWCHNQEGSPLQRLGKTKEYADKAFGVYEAVNINYDPIAVCDKIKERWELELESSRRGIHLSFDVDSIDPNFTPSTGTPVAFGIHPFRQKKLFECLSPYIVSMDVTEVNPKLVLADVIKKTKAATGSKESMMTQNRMGCDDSDTAFDQNDSYRVPDDPTVFSPANWLFSAPEMYAKLLASRDESAAQTIKYTAMLVKAAFSKPCKRCYAFSEA